AASFRVRERYVLETRYRRALRARRPRSQAQRGLVDRENRLAQALRLRGRDRRGERIVLFKGRPNPKTIDHMSFHLPSMAALRAALAHLKKRGVEIEDPGEEIGPEAPGSKNMGLWFHDPDGYRWELAVLASRKRRRPSSS